MYIVIQIVWKSLHKVEDYPENNEDRKARNKFSGRKRQIKMRYFPEVRASGDKIGKTDEAPTTLLKEKLGCSGIGSAGKALSVASVTRSQFFGIA